MYTNIVGGTLTGLIERNTMIRLLFNHLRQLLTDNQAPNVPITSGEDEDDTQEFTESLDSACAKITVYIREDGEFAITSEFYRNNEEVTNASGTVLHMINSGSLADYFLKSLHLWAEEHDNSETFIVEIIKRWKLLFDNDKPTIQNNLAVDPSDVFALKSLKKDQ